MHGTMNVKKNLLYRFTVFCFPSGAPCLVLILDFILSHTDEIPFTAVSGQLQTDPYKY